MAIKVFYSYAPEDEDLQRVLEKHLKVMSRSKEIEDWDVRDISAGAEWRKQVDEHLETADIILLLLSADFLASDYCYEFEMRRALERHLAGEARVIPIILRACDWQKVSIGQPPDAFSLGKLQPLPKDGPPLKERRDRDAAFVEIVNGLREIIAEVKPASRSDHYRPEVPDLLPYLCDRRDQEDLLEIALSYKDPRKLRRPFVCIIHGDEPECHDKFRERLQVSSLPRFLDVDINQTSIQACLLTPPSSSLTRQAAIDILYKNLAEKFTGKRAAPKEKVVEEISRAKAPIMIYSHLSSEAWRESGAKLIDAFLSFWNSFDDLPAGPHLISCLFIAHVADKPEMITNKNEAVSYLRSLRTFRVTDQTLENLRSEAVPEAFLSQLASLKDQKVIGESAFLAALAAVAAEQDEAHRAAVLTHAMSFEVGGYDNLWGLILPELSAVAEGDVINWIRDDRFFRDFCRRHTPYFCNVEESLPSISAIYEAAARISMRPLAAELRELLRRKRCSG